MKTNTKLNQKQIGAQSRPEQLNTEKPKAERPRIDLALRHANRALDTEKLLSLMRTSAPEFFAVAEVIGKWVWVRLEGKQPPQVTSVLAELGFHWNNTRQTWQHPCGTILFDAATYDPRRRYGSYFAADHKAA